MEIQNREQRKLQAKPVKFKALMNEFSGSHLLIQLNKSANGFGGVFLGHQFPGKGAVLEGLQKKYTVRWVKVHFGFIYRFGLEAIPSVA
jgi:hypothetical protein